MESDCMGFYAHCCWKHSDGPWCPPAEIYTWPMTSFVSADVQVKMVESLTNLVPQQLILMTTSASKSRTIYEIAQQLGYNKDGNVAYDYLRCRSRKGAFGKSAPRVQGELTGPHSWNIQYQIWLGSKLINTALDQMCIVVVWKTACRLSLLPHHISADSLLFSP